MPARRASLAKSDGGQPTAAQELFAPGGDDQYDQEIDPSRRVRFHTDSSRPKSKSPLPSPRRRKKAASAGDVIQTFGLEFGERSRSIQDLLEDISAARRVRKPSGAYSMKLPMLEDVVVPPPGGDKAIFSKISQKELARLRADIAKNVEVSLRERGWKAADKVGRRLEGGPGKYLRGSVESTWAIERKMLAWRSQRSYRNLPDDGRQLLRVYYSCSFMSLISTS